jgi:hypothetical protein
MNAPPRPGRDKSGRTSRDHCSLNHHGSPSTPLGKKHSFCTCRFHLRRRALAGHGSGAPCAPSLSTLGRADVRAWLESPRVVLSDSLYGPGRLRHCEPGAPSADASLFVLGLIGLITGSAGAIAAISMANLGPNWYPIALAITGFPCVWLGGVLYSVRHERRNATVIEEREGIRC